ncbi:protein hokC [Escherichia coli]|nr:protein hokC [Escherichia coli]
MFAPLSVIFPPAVGAALETKKALWEVHTRTGQRGVVFSTAYEPE